MTGRCARAGCSNPGIYSTADGQGVLHHFCTEHLWGKTPLSDTAHTCDMLGANPPSLSLERCGRLANVKWTNVTNGETRYFCARCRRKHFPTDAEKAADERKELKSARTYERWSTFVFTPIGWLVGIGLLALAAYGVIAFAHWCWRNS
jgi:hypothetical protein